MIHLPIDFSIDHIGVAVRSLTEGRKSYEAMGLKVSDVEEVVSEKVRVLMIELKNSSRIELLEPTSNDSVIAKFLEKRGPGVHHICLRVDDIQAVIARLKATDVTLIHEKPFKGAHNCLVAFIHPKSVGGVLIELSQKLS